MSWYNAQLSATQVSGEWSASKNSAGSTPTETETVTDPGGNTLTWVYDLLNGGRVLSQTDARGETTTYGYNVDGFQNEVVNPDGDYTQTGYDVRGNVVSTTTCQDQATDECSTSYDSYYPDDKSSTLTPRPAQRRAAHLERRPVGVPQRHYLSNEYTYNSLGELTAVTTPPVAGSSSGRTTSYLYTDGTDHGRRVPGGDPAQGPAIPGDDAGRRGHHDVVLRERRRRRDDRPGRAADRLRLRPGGAGDLRDGHFRLLPAGLTTRYAYDKDGQVVTENDPPVTNRVTGAIHTAQTTTVV